MKHKWKKFFYSSAVVLLSGTMVFSYMEPVQTVFAEDTEDTTETAVPEDSGNAENPSATEAPENPEESTAQPAETQNADATDSPAATEEPEQTEAPAETTAPAPTPAATPSARIARAPAATEEPTDIMYYIVGVKDIDREDAYFHFGDDESTYLFMLPGTKVKIEPVVYAVHNNGVKTVVENADVSIREESSDGNPDKIVFDDKSNTLTAPEIDNSEYYSEYYNFELTYDDSYYYHLSVVVTPVRYSINAISPSNIVMGPQETKKNAVKVTVYDEFKNEYRVVNDYTVSDSDDVKLDPATGDVTSYEKYGSFIERLYYKDTYPNNYWTVNINVVSKVLDLSFSQDEISLNQNAGKVHLSQLTGINFIPYQSYNSPLTFKSSNENVLTVGKDDNENWGINDVVITPKAVGDATITATAESGVSASVRVHITKSGKAAKIQFDKNGYYGGNYKDIYLRSGKSTNLEYVLLDDNGNDVTASAKDEVKWDESSYMSTLKVERDGDKITATGHGHASLTASIGAGDNQKLSWNIHVVDSDPESIAFSQKSYTLRLGDVSKSVYFTAKPDSIDPDDLDNLEVTSSDEKVVSVSNSGSSHWIYPTGAGTATLTVKTANGKTDTASVTVEDGDFAYYISADNQGKTVSIRPGDTVQLRPVYQDFNGNTIAEKPKDETVTYSVSSSDKNDLLLVDHKDGTAEIKALKNFHSAGVTATLSNGNSAYWYFQCLPDVTNLSFKKSRYVLTDENSLYLGSELNISPDEAAGTNLVWKTSDIRSADVSGGSVTLLDYDKDVTITASTQDGKTAAKTTVHLQRAGAPSSITLNGNQSSDLKTYVGYSVPMRFEFNPEYSSSKANIKIDDPDHVTGLNDYFSNFRNGSVFNSYSINGNKAGTASITVTSAKNKSVSKKVNITVANGKPSEKEIDLEYGLIPQSVTGYGNSGTTLNNPKEYTFLKGNRYEIVVTAKIAPRDGYVNNKFDTKGNLRVVYGDNYFDDSYRWNEVRGFVADKTGSGEIKLENGSTIKYQVVDAIVNKPEVETPDLHNDPGLQSAIKKITNENTGMESALANAASNVNLSGDKKIAEAAENLKENEELKVEVTNKIKYESVEKTASGTKIVVSITPTYTVTVFDSKKNQAVKVVETGKANVTEPVRLSIPVGSEYHGRTLYVRHIKDDAKHTSRIYVGTVDDNGNLVFDNPDGFSTFEFTTADPSKVTNQTDTGYVSLQDAVNNGLSQDTFTVKDNYTAQDGTDITVNREIKFTLVNKSKQKFNIKAGKGYKLTRDGDAYVVIKDVNYTAPHVEINGKEYKNLQDAVNHAANNATITVNSTYTAGLGTTVTVNKAITFKLNNKSNLKFTVKAAKGYTVKNSGNTYTVTKDQAPAKPAAKTVTMYRAYNPNSGEHFYTKNKQEFDYLVSIGWNNEGIGWIAPEKSNTPVYRLYNANGGEHHYTTNVNERNALLAAGWKDEGIGWYSDDQKRTPLYRQYNPNAFANNHNYTTSKQENDYLVSLGWKAEGIGWYGVRAK